VESFVVRFHPLTQAIRVIFAPVFFMPGFPPVPGCTAMAGATNAIENGLSVPAFHDGSGAGAAGTREGFAVGGEV